VLAIYWVATIIALKGLSWVGKISKWGGMIGTMIPAGILIVLGIIYISTGGHNYMDMSQSFFPDLKKIDNIVLASSIFLFYAGMEMMGVHVMDVNNPSRNYPKAIIIGSLATVCIFILGTFSLGFIIPAKDISLTQSLLIGFDNYFKHFHISWAGPIIAVALMFGVLAGVLTWVAGPSKGIFTVGKAGYLPPFFQRSNKRGVQRNILIVQGIIVTLLSLLFDVMPSVQAFFQILSQLTVLLYLIMYMLMFAAGIVLRYKMKSTPRPFRLGKGNGLMWLMGVVGFCGSLLAFILSFVPPGQIATGSHKVWFSVLIIGCIIAVAIPYIIYAMRKPSWRDPNADFAPFHWEASQSSAATASATNNAPANSSATSGNTAQKSKQMPPRSQK
jgi:putative glutamate/gamma-aminobutyrate antiporter